MLVTKEKARLKTFYATMVVTRLEEVVCRGRNC